MLMIPFLALSRIAQEIKARHEYLKGINSLYAKLASLSASALEKYSSFGPSPTLGG